MQIGRLGAWYSMDKLTGPQIPSFLVLVERLNYDVLWYPESRGFESLSLAGFMLGNSKKLKIGSSIASIYARDAFTARRGLVSLNTLYGDRFILGLGVSHVPMVEGVRGHTYAKPVPTMRAYLDGITKDQPGSEEWPIAVAALGPLMLKLSAERTRGALPYNTTPEHTARAAKILGPGKWLAVEQKVSLETDAGKVYEYFLGAFALKEGQKGGVFYTPEAIVKLIVEIIEPYHGRIFDPACGSGGMFVQSAGFVERHHKAADREISIFGIEKDITTVNLNKMNLAVHGLSGDVRVANSYYDKAQELFAAAFKDRGFDFVMANPPFNVSGVDKERLEKDPRFPFGLPNPDNANYLWIQLFYASLNATGRAGFVMASSAGDARGSEQLIRQKLIESGAVDVIVSVGSNFFYTVTLPCTLWFLDRGKAKGHRKDKVLFIDARHIYHQIDRAHRDFTSQQIEFLANIVRLYRGEKPELQQGSSDLMAEKGLDEGYVDAPGLCKVATLADIEAQGWSLNPGRYVGASEREADEVEFADRLEELNEELEALNAEARELEGSVAENLTRFLEISL